MKDFNYYIEKDTEYNVKIVSRCRIVKHDGVTLEKALRSAYNIAKAHRVECKILIRPVGCNSVLYMRAFTIKPDGDLHDDVQNISLDYIKQNLSHGCNRWIENNNE